MTVLQTSPGLPGVGDAETIERFCRTCVSFHESRARFLPDEAPGFVPPACYSEGCVMPPGWCRGELYQEDIP